MRHPSHFEFTMETGVLYHKSFIKMSKIGVLVQRKTRHLKCHVACTIIITRSGEGRAGHAQTGLTSDILMREHMHKSIGTVECLL